MVLAAVKAACGVAPIALPMHLEQNGSGSAMSEVTDNAP